MGKRPRCGTEEDGGAKHVCLGGHDPVSIKLRFRLRSLMTSATSVARPLRWMQPAGYTGAPNSHRRDDGNRRCFVYEHLISTPFDETK
jgi:hypothetical protein